jgi:hypothetical protein
VPLLKHIIENINLLSKKYPREETRSGAIGVDGVIRMKSILNKIFIYLLSFLTRIHARVTTRKTSLAAR